MLGSHPRTPLGFLAVLFSSLQRLFVGGVLLASACCYTELLFTAGAGGTAAATFAVIGTEGLLFDTAGAGGTVFPV